MINLVIDILKANSTLTTLVPSTRIYPLIQLQGGTIPAVVVQLVSTNPNDTQDRVSEYDDNAVQITSIADNPAQAWAISEAVRGAIDGYTGGSIAQIRFQSQATDIFEGTEVFSVTQGYSCHLKRDGGTLPIAIAGLGLFNLDDINNVDNDVVNALDRQALVYDEATSQWIADGVGQVVIPVRNPSRSTPIAVGTVLKATGAQGDRILVAPFNADLDDPRYLVGIASEELGATAETKDGHAQVYGELRNIDTDAYEVGDVLYPNSTGALVTTENQYPIAIVLRKQQNTGRIFIRTWTPGRSRYDADAETLRQEMDTSLSNADIELYFSAQADGYGLVESPGSDSVVNLTPPENYQVERAIFYNNTGLASYVSDSGWSTLEANTESYAAAKARVEDYIRGGTYGKLPCTFAIVRTEELKFQGLLDLYPGAAAAYSLRLLDKDYTGSAIRVRRASDNAEQDIGFDGNGDLDTTSLATFCSGTDGFVKVWYDQAGANDATQTTTGSQPKIYDSATGVVTENGKPALSFDGSVNHLSILNSTATFKFLHDGTTATTYSVSRVGGGSAVDDTFYVLFGTAAASADVGAYLSYEDRTAALASDAIRGGILRDVQGAPACDSIQNDAFLPNQQSLLYGLFDADNATASNRFRGAINGGIDVGNNTLTNAPSTANATNDLQVGRYLTGGSGSGAYWLGNMQEIVIYPSDQSANRTGIESNINTYYSIYP